MAVIPQAPVESANLNPGFTQFPAAKPGRLDSVDLLRGLVMVIMALDHVRDYFSYLRFAPEDLSHTFGALFFTRWITHFCAPSFFFLAGTGAYLSLGKGKHPAQLSSFLWKRGLWLVFLELTVVGFGWTFIPRPILALLVIWALGWSMVVMALMVRLPMAAIATLGVGMMALHDLFDKVNPATFGKLSWLWMMLHQPGFYQLKANFLPPQAGFFILYTLIPWVGVMAAGYALGPILRKPVHERRRLLWMIGGAMVLAFLLLRATNVYGNPPADAGFASPGPFVHQKTAELSVIAFLNVEKYPPSLDYLLMTLGPAMMMLAWFDRFNFKSAAGRLWEKILVYGRVPMFYYLVHIYLIHLMAIAVALMYHQPVGWLWNGVFTSAPLPDHYGHGLPFIYAMWMLAVAILYYPCKWFAGVKQRRRDWWLGYL